MLEKYEDIILVTTGIFFLGQVLIYLGKMSYSMIVSAISKTNEDINILIENKVEQMLRDNLVNTSQVAFRDSRKPRYSRVQMLKDDSSDISQANFREARVGMDFHDAELDDAELDDAELDDAELDESGDADSMSMVDKLRLMHKIRQARLDNKKKKDK